MHILTKSAVSAAVLIVLLLQLWCLPNGLLLVLMTEIHSYATLVIIYSVPTLGR